MLFFVTPGLINVPGSLRYDRYRGSDHHRFNTAYLPRQSRFGQNLHGLHCI